MRIKHLATQRAVIVGTKNIFPVDDGKKAVIHGFLLYLIDKLGAENVCYAVLGTPPQETQQQLPCTVEWIQPPRRLHQIWSIFTESILLRRRSIQEALFYSPETIKALESLVDNWKADLVLLDTVRIGQLLEQARPESTVRRLLYMDDLFYLRFRSMLNASADQPDTKLDPSGTFASNLPSFARALIRIDIVKRGLLKFEMNAIEHRELQSPSQFDKCLLINPQEADVLKERTAASNIYPIKPIMFSDPCAVERNFNGQPEFIFFGTLRNPAHLFSVCYFLEHCMPHVVRAIPNVKLKIIGGGANDALRNLAAKYEQEVELLGYVENIDEAMQTACALLIPLRFGGGLRLKTLTAFYFGLPVITTDYGINGLCLQEDAGFIRENDVSNFPTHMQQLLDCNYNAALSDRASASFKQHYSKEAIYAEYDELFDLTES